MVFCSLGKIANVHSLGLFIFVSLSPLVMKVYATDNIQFNTDVILTLHLRTAFVS